MAVVSGSAFAQDWSICIDPENTQPRSTDHFAIGQQNILTVSATGVSGTTAYFGDDGPCQAGVVTAEMRGGSGFAIGTEGTVQDQNWPDPGNTFIDEFMVLTFGMPQDPARPFQKTAISVNGARTLFGANGLGFFVGASDRYYQITTTNDGIAVRLRVNVIGDASRYEWQLTNTSTTDTRNVGLWWAQMMGMLSVFPDSTGAAASHNQRGGGKNGFVLLPSGRPPVTDVRFNRLLDPNSFPAYAEFLFSQSTPVGLRVDNGPSPQTRDANGNSDATDVDEFVLGNTGQVVGFDTTDIGDGITEDTGFLGDVGYIQKYNEQPVLPGESRTIVQYFRSPWGNGNYSGLYTAVVDAPRLVSSDPDGLNGLAPNPMTIRVYIDNAQGFARAGNEISLQDVSITLSFPTNQLSLAPGEVATKNITSVAARQMRFVDFTVEADGIEFGDLPYRVAINSTPGGSKTIDGFVRVSTTPKLNVVTDAQLVSMPWRVDDTSWEAILGLQAPEDFRAYRWDPQQQGYVVASSAQRGFGTWIVSNAEFGPVDIQGNPSVPSDIPTGAPNIQLKSGWNMIGNPYPYAIPLAQIIGVPAGSSSGVRTWNELVSSGFVGSALVYYDTQLADYVFVQGNEAVLLPNRGYWVFVNTQQDLTLSYPAVFAPGLPGSTRRATNPWPQTDRQWRLQLAVRSDKSQDTQNYLGVAATKQEATALRLPEIPMTPVQNVSVSIEEMVNGKAMRMSQAYVEKASRRTWKIVATTTEATTATLTFPNLSTVPRNVRFRLTDLATNEVRDLRQLSGYAFTTNGAANREFQLEMIPGGTSRAVIGNVVVSQPGRNRQAPFTIKYTLSNDASTTIRILSGSGKEVFTVARGRADRTGENEAVWTMRDNANRLVAPGSYRVEILAETAEGERVRKTIPVNVIR